MNTCAYCIRAPRKGPKEYVTTLSMYMHAQNFTLQEVLYMSMIIQ